MHAINNVHNAFMLPTTFLDKEGWEHILVVLKASYSIPGPGEDATPIPTDHPKAVPLFMSDIFAGEPGLSAPLYENDFAARKAKCDVVFNAFAHAPGGRPVTSIVVEAVVGDMSKKIRVIGNRKWKSDLLRIMPGEPEAFTSMPLHYGHAFGGGLQTIRERGMMAENPVGKGYSASLARQAVNDLDMPNLELADRPLKKPDAKYPAIALSATARNFYPRHKLAGTYDQTWKENVAPFLPADFDYDFFQCAPEDQRISYPQGGERVLLVNMMRDAPRCSFALPDVSAAPVNIVRDDVTVETVHAVPDTLFFEPEERRFCIVWRASSRLGHRGLQEVRTVIAGPLCEEWREAARHGKDGCAGCEEAKNGLRPAHCPDRPGFPAQSQATEGRTA